MHFRLLLSLTLIVLFVGCGVRETDSVSPIATAQPLPPLTQTPWPTITWSSWTATEESLRATSMARVANDIATSVAMPTPEVWPTIITPTTVPVRGPFGFVLCEPVPWDKVIIENCWVESYNNSRVGVTAGALKTDPGQGALQIRDEVYLTPTYTGKARIVQADGLFLTIRTAGGDYFGFDVVTLQWRTPQLTATPRPREDYPQGIIPCPEDSPNFQYDTCWSALVGERYDQIQTGVFTYSPNEAVLWWKCQHIVPGGAMCEGISYDPPITTTHLRIIDVDGRRLILQVDDGTLLRFDLETRKWIMP